MKLVRILLADDHFEFRRAIKKYLVNQAGIVVVGEAADGEEAVRRAIDLNPDLVLLDINMPGRNGFDALKMIKEAVPRTKVVMLSMFADDRYRQMANRYKADGFIDKADLKMNIFQNVDNIITSRYIM